MLGEHVKDVKKKDQYGDFFLPCSWDLFENYVTNFIAAHKIISTFPLSVINFFVCLQISCCFRINWRVIRS